MAASSASFCSVRTPSVSSEPMVFPSSADCLLDPMQNLSLSHSRRAIGGIPRNFGYGFNINSGREQGLGLVVPGLHDQFCHGSNGMIGFCPCLQCSTRTLPSYPQQVGFAFGLYPSSSPSSSYGSPVNDAYLTSGFELHDNTCPENFVGSSVSGPHMRNHGGSGSSFSAIPGNTADIAFNDRSVVGRPRGIQVVGSTNNDILDKLEAIGILYVALDEKGSRYLQKLLCKSDSRTVARLFSCLVGSFDKIMQDQFGNFLFLKLLQVCSFEQLREIVGELTSRNRLLVALSISEYGSRSVQRLLTRLKKEKKLLQIVTSYLRDHLVFLIKHRVGTRIIQHCLKYLEYHQNEFIFLTAIRSCVELGTHELGCVRLTDCLKHSRWPHRERLLHIIADYSLCLAQDPYGNYLVQAVIELEIPEVLTLICDKLKDHFDRLSTQKYGGYVVEKLMQSCMMEVVVSNLVLCSRLGDVARDQYGNYIIQKAWKVTKGYPQLQLELLEAIEPFMRSLQHHLHGKNVYSCIRDSIDSE